MWRCFSCLFWYLRSLSSFSLSLGIFGRDGVFVGKLKMDPVCSRLLTGVPF